VSEVKVTGVRLSGSENSTIFTKCCGVAVGDDEQRCPSCKATVLPVGRAARWEAAYGPCRTVDRLSKSGGAK